MLSMPSACSILHTLNQEVVACTRCPRLVSYREAIGKEKRRAYMDWEYWAKPVPGFGDPNAHVLILGLAPGAHGSNRTGRMFTGDASGRFMYPILHEVGFASQGEAESRDDGLQLIDAYITAAVRCAPPDNKPLPEEIASCATYLERELAALRNVKVVVALGRIGFDAYLNYLKRQGHSFRRSEFVFAHAAENTLPNGVVLLASYHPSNQNTATGRLTAKMFADVFRRARVLAGAS
jgi:uracil-DNA glycosylase family 4